MPWGEMGAIVTAREKTCNLKTGMRLFAVAIP